jgi:peptidoglycan/LPS O-acetylase OafA/YrhL
MSFSLRNPAMRGIPGLRAESNKLPHLDVMRFVAAFGIVLVHSLVFFFPKERRTEAAHEIFGLTLFVDFFFVFSGFVIAYYYHERVGSTAWYGTFLQRRVGRLFPLHWLTLVLSIAMFAAMRRLEHLCPSVAITCSDGLWTLIPLPGDQGTLQKVQGTEWTHSPKS